MNNPRTPLQFTGTNITNYAILDVSDTESCDSIKNHRISYKSENNPSNENSPNNNDIMNVL